MRGCRGCWIKLKGYGMGRRGYWIRLQGILDQAPRTVDWRAESKGKTSLGEEGKGKAPGPVFSGWLDLTVTYTGTARTSTMKRNNFPHGHFKLRCCKIQHGGRLAGSVHASFFHNSTGGSKLFTKGVASFGHAVFNCSHVLGCAGIVWLMWSPTVPYLKALQHHSAALRWARSESGLPNAPTGIAKLTEQDECTGDGL